MKIRNGSGNVIDFGPSDARSWFDPRPSDIETRTKRHIRHLKSKYGITPDEYLRLLDAQGGVCAICGMAETVRRGAAEPRLSVDHDHATGLVRGLLCQSCNVVCGMFRDDPIWAADFAGRMAAYLAQARARAA